MEPPDGSRNDASAEAPPRPRRLSMEEDFHYREVMTQSPARPSRPPSYASAIQQPPPGTQNAAARSQSGHVPPPDVLPGYSCDIHIEGVFMRKMEMEETVKRAEYRNWHMVYVVLHGTALNVYQVKKDRGWWSSRSDGPNVSPDSPPWIKKSSLEKSYSLLHADAGIAADYRKRRYVIRLRTETDQFLLSCVELSTLVTWLDLLFAAIAVAAPIDERGFPRDQSIPRIQRLRWLRDQDPRGQDSSSIADSQRPDTRRPSVSSAANSDLQEDASLIAGQANSLAEEAIEEADDDTATIGSSTIGPSTSSTRTGHPTTGRLSTSSYPNEEVDPDTGKWSPRHLWTRKHDHLYARLCFSVLLFKSPRKSNYIVSKGKQWFVDWTSGRMLRVLPPSYGEIDVGPWQTIMTGNRYI